MALTVAVVGGAGRAGRAVSSELAQQGVRVRVLDARPGAAHRVAQALGGHAHGQRLHGPLPRVLPPLLADVDAVVDATGPTHETAEPMVRTVLGEGVPLVDLCDHPATLRRLLSTDGQQTGATAVVGAGFSPGLTDLMVRAGYETLGGATEARISWAIGLPDLGGPAHVRRLLTQLEHLEGQPVLVELPDPLGKRPLTPVQGPEHVTLGHALEGLGRIRVRAALAPVPTEPVARLLVGSGLTRSTLALDALGGVLDALRRRAPLPGPSATAARVDLVPTEGAAPEATLAVVDRLPRLIAVPVARVAIDLATGALEDPGVHPMGAVTEPGPLFKRMAERGVVVRERG